MNSTYRTVTEVTRFGPYVTKIIVPLPSTVSSADLSPDTFNTGAPNIHFSLFDKVVDTSGHYKNEDGSPFEYFGHATWTYMLDDECRLDFDGTPVFVDGHEVSLLQWLALQSR